MQETYKRSTVDELYYREESCIYTGGPDAIFSVIAYHSELILQTYYIWEGKPYLGTSRT